MNKTNTKKLLLAPILILMLISVTAMTGCVYDMVEVKGHEYDSQTNTVTLRGSAPVEDPVRRQLNRAYTNPQVEFWFYENPSDEYSKPDTSIHEAVSQDDFYVEQGIVYFSADISDLNPNTEYHVRALGWYYDPWGDLEDGWGNSVVYSFIPAQLNGEKGPIQINQIIKKEDININTLKIIIERIPVLKELFY